MCVWQRYRERQEMRERTSNTPRSRILDISCIFISLLEKHTWSLWPEGRLTQLSLERERVAVISNWQVGTNFFSGLPGGNTNQCHWLLQSTARVRPGGTSQFPITSHSYTCFLLISEMFCGLDMEWQLSHLSLSERGEFCELTSCPAFMLIFSWFCFLLIYNVLIIFCALTWNEALKTPKIRKGTDQAPLKLPLNPITPRLCEGGFVWLNFLIMTNSYCCTIEESSLNHDVLGKIFI